MYKDPKRYFSAYYGYLQVVDKLSLEDKLAIDEYSSSKIIYNLLTENQIKELTIGEFSALVREIHKYAEKELFSIPIKEIHEYTEKEMDGQEKEIGFKKEPFKQKRKFQRKAV